MRAHDEAAPIGATRSDVWLVPALLSWGVAEQIMLNGTSGLTEALAFCLAVTVPLAWRRQRPAPVLAIVATAVLLRGLTAARRNRRSAPAPAKSSQRCLSRPPQVAPRTIPTAPGPRLAVDAGGVALSLAFRSTANGSPRTPQDTGD